MNLAETAAKLHEKLALALLAKIESGECTAADLGVARQFLKDNGIDDAGARSGSPIKKLEDVLDMPFPEEEPILKSDVS